ncbi:glycoside hydrolase family 3 protein [uncultured Eudoraea sp.]|uniref:glycoside hydrolase family 3 protein n=1 Tax=uncultured Eudoraea sp. TaxID=1035614 RepID=UPI00263395BA|nr:glycoside hydrolase family 3 protein [uncultured Eudoraea sp.]
MVKKGQIRNYKIIDYQSAANSLTLAEKVGQFFMPAAFINDSEEEILKLQELIRKYHLGGLCFFHSRASAATNYEGKKQVVYNKDSFSVLKSLIKRYQQVAKYPLIISIDAEWGLAMRIENTPQYPYAITLGALDNNHDDVITEVGRNIASDCKLAGVHWNFSPVVDINSNPENPVIGYRSFGSDRHNVVQKSLAFAKGLQSKGILTSAKHFPGHGDTATDSHLGLPIITKSKDELLENELYPFIQLIQNGVDSIMVGHLAVPGLTGGSMEPSSISKKMIKGLLREELGFQGLVVSDAMNMHAVSKMYSNKGDLEWAAFDAGNDILCFAEHIPEGIDKIQLNATSTQIEEAFKRVWELKEKAINSEVKIPNELSKPDILNMEIAKNSMTIFRGNISDINTLKEEGFLSISNLQKTDNLFITLLEEHLNFKITSLHEVSYKSDMAREENILLSLFPPQVKPAHNFGFTETEIRLINDLISSKNVVLYLFGNPYALRVFDYKKIKAVVLVYQEFSVFQRVAAEHFFGRLKANGKLPVVL